MVKEKDKLVVIKWFNRETPLSEIYQKTGIIFAFVNNNSEMCHAWVKCRDFLHDAVKCQLTNTGCNIYGFSFAPDKNPNIDTKKMRMLVSKHNIGKEEKSKEEFKKKMVAALKLVNHFEKYAKVSLTKLQEVDAKGSNKDAVYLFTGPAMWLYSPFLVSMYTFLIRLGDKEITFDNAIDLKHKLKAVSESSVGHDNDISYLKTLWNKLHWVIKNRNVLFLPDKEKGFHDIYFSKVAGNISLFHNNCGILSLGSRNTPEQTLNKKVEELFKK